MRIELRPSRLLGAALGIAHGAAGAGLWAAGVHVVLAAAGTLVLAASLGWQWWARVAMRPGDAIVAVELREDGTAAAGTRDGRWSEATVDGSTFVTRWLTAVHLRMTGTRRSSSALLLPDNVEREAFRRARVWLRWKALAGADGDASSA